jgi:hypothetical protein
MRPHTLSQMVANTTFAAKNTEKELYLAREVPDPAKKKSRIQIRNPVLFRFMGRLMADLLPWEKTLRTISGMAPGLLTCPFNNL